MLGSGTLITPSMSVACQANFAFSLALFCNNIMQFNLSVFICTLCIGMNILSMLERRRNNPYILLFSLYLRHWNGVLRWDLPPLHTALPKAVAAKEQETSL